MSDWFKLDEESPPVDTPVLVYFPPTRKVGGRQAVAYLTTTSDPPIPIWWSTVGDEFLGYEDDVTHWMPQQDPPKDGEK